MTTAGIVSDPGHGDPRSVSHMAIRLATPDLAVFEALALAEGVAPAAIIARHVAIVAVEVEAALVAAAADGQHGIPHPTAPSPLRCPAGTGLPLPCSPIGAGASAVAVTVAVDPAVAALLRAVTHAVDDADLAVVVGGIAAAEAARIRAGRERWLDAVMATPA